MWDERVADVWASAGQRPEDEVIEAIGRLCDERPPGDPAALYERASAFDFAGREADAEPLYRQALAAGLDPHRQPRAVVRPRRPPSRSARSAPTCPSTATR